jgi:geranylgeranyl pyrophosphate synthase
MYLEDYISDIRNVAICVELLHNSHLVHDDLIDQDEKRRGEPTFHVSLRQEITDLYKNSSHVDLEQISSLYGRNVSILGATLGYFFGIDIIKESQFPENLKLLALNEYSEAIDYVIKGEIIEEYLDFHNITMSLEQYLNIAEMMRARVFEKSTKIGAILAKGNLHYQIKPLSEAMLRIGQAYAIRDDILDMEEDIKSQKKKILYILAIQNTDEEQSKILNDIFNKKEKISAEDLRTVKDIFGETNAIVVAEHFSKNLVSQAKNYLNDIYPDLNKDQKNFFYEFADYIYLREM